MLKLVGSVENQDGGFLVINIDLGLGLGVDGCHMTVNLRGKPPKHLRFDSARSRSDEQD